MLLEQEYLPKDTSFMYNLRVFPNTDVVSFFEEKKTCKIKAMWMDGRDNRHFAHINLEKISKCGCQKKTYYFYLHEELHKPIKLPKLNSSLGLQIKRVCETNNKKMWLGRCLLWHYTETWGSPSEASPNLSWLSIYLSSF